MNLQMKYIALSFFLFYLTKCQISNQLDTKNPEKNPYCVGECQLMNKYKSIFPLEGEEKTLNSPLNEFNYKYIFVYKDHLAIYWAINQNDPIPGKWNKPSQSEFLNNFPLDSFQLTCKGGLSVCTIEEYQNEVLKEKGQKYQLNKKVSESINYRDAYKKCLILIQELNEPFDEQFIICGNELEDIFKLKEILNHDIQQQNVKNTVGRVFMINQDQNDLIEINLHLSDKKIYADNKEKPESEGSLEKDYKLHFSYILGTDLPPVAAQSCKIQKIEIPWKGEADKKPEMERCFLLESKGQDGKQGERKFICIFSSTDGNQPLQAADAFSVANEWVTKINRQISKNNKEKQFNALKFAKKLNYDSPELDNVKQDLHIYASELTIQCKDLIKNGKKTQEQCDKDKMTKIADKVAELCNENKECLKAIAVGIKKGNLPLSDEGVKQAWDPNNIYRGKDKTSSQISTENEGESQGPISKQINEKPVVKTDAQTLGVPGDTSDKSSKSNLEETDTNDYAQTKVGRTVPSIQEITKAANTFKQCFQGKEVEKVDGAETCCQTDKKEINLSRAIGLLPFIARFDPWMEYLGYIRDVQSSSK